MKFYFNYEEILMRTVVIEAENLGEAILEVEKQIDEEQIVLDSKDFLGGSLRMPLKQNFLPSLEKFGEKVKEEEDFDILVDAW